MLRLCRCRFGCFDHLGLGFGGGVGVGGVLSRKVG